MSRTWWRDGVSDRTVKHYPMPDGKARCGVEIVAEGVAKIRQVAGKAAKKPCSQCTTLLRADR